MLPPLLERDRNGLRLLVVVHQLSLLDVEQGGDSLVCWARHLVVSYGNGSRRLALRVFRGVFAYLAIGRKVDERSLREELQVAERRKVLLVNT